MSDIKLIVIQVTQEPENLPIPLERIEARVYMEKQTKQKDYTWRSTNHMSKYLKVTNHSNKLFNKIYSL